MTSGHGSTHFFDDKRKLVRHCSCFLVFYWFFRYSPRASANAVKMRQNPSKSVEFAVNGVALVTC